MVRGSTPGTSLGRDKVDLSIATDVLDDSVAMRLIDEVNGREHFPLVDEEEGCRCSSFVRLDPGQDVDLYAKFPALPADVDRVSLHAPGFPSFDNVRIAP